MKCVSKLGKLILSASLLISILASCASHPDEEQIKALEETKTAALSAEKALADKKQEKGALEAKVAAKKAELEKVKTEKEVVLKKLEEKNKKISEEKKKKK